MKVAFAEDGIYAYAVQSPTALGGAEREHWLLARALAEAGWTATVGVRGFLNPGERRDIDGVDYVGIGQGPILPAWRRFLISERPEWFLRKCSSHLWGPLVEIAKSAGVRTIFHAAFDLDLHPRHAPLSRPRWWPLYLWGLWRTDRIFVQHSGQLAALSHGWRSKTCVLPKVCEIDDSKVPTPHGDRRPYVAWVGRLVPFKRPDLLVEIASRTPSVRFVVCGGLPVFPYSPEAAAPILERLCALQNVEYLGQVSPAMAAQVIADAALLLSTSDVEGFPNTFVQAWSTGTPVVTLTVDPDRIIHRMRLGAVVGNADRAIAEITALVNTPRRRDDVGVRAVQFVRDNYSARTVVGIFERALMDADRRNRGTYRMHV
jgi:glycosyltransferase involved in cell wall biosynthesis